MDSRRDTYLNNFVDYVSDRGVRGSEQEPSLREGDPEDDHTADAGSSTTELPDVASSSSAIPLSAAPASGGTTGGAATGGASTGGAAGASNIGLIKITIPVEAAIVRAIGGHSTGAWSQSGGGFGGAGVAPVLTTQSQSMEASENETSTVVCFKSQ